MKSFYSNGKLLLSGEYLVLDGAIALAVPSIYGQSLEIEKGENGLLKWSSLDENGTIWFETEFEINDHEIASSLNSLSAERQARNDISERLLQILKAAKKLNPRFLTDVEGYRISTKLGFPKNWGLGTSSTLISNVASWAKVDAYRLLELTFGGSGYDIACAKATGSLTFQLHKKSNEILGHIPTSLSTRIQNNNSQDIKRVNFNPSFKDHIYFVHLNEKQNSRDGIKRYRENTSDLSSAIIKINTITKEMITCKLLDEFQELIDEHEQLISEIINKTPIKPRLFSDFNGSIKSLGAWGGDFVMVASNHNPTTYFESKGYTTILSYSEMVLA